MLDEVCNSINQTEGQAYDFRLELFRWEDQVTPRIGPKPQRVIDQQTPVYNIYLGIMSASFGTPTGPYGSGTEKEFKKALKKWKKAGSPWIMFYFDSVPKMSGDPDQARQYVQVCEFRTELEKQGIVGTYSGIRVNANGFFEQVSIHLRKIVHQLLRQQKPERGARPRKTAPAKLIVPPAYTKWLLNRCVEVELMGLKAKHGAGVRLNHVYTPLTTTMRSEDMGYAGGKPPDETQAECDDAPQLLLELFDKQSLYVSGAPGVGKSTFCRWVTWLTCSGVMPAGDVPAPQPYQEKFPEQLRGRLPVPVRL